MAEEKCCVRLDAADWDKKEIEWEDKPFYKAKYRTIFHIPLNIGGVVTRTMAELDSRGLAEDPPMMLSKEESMFSSTMLFSLNEDASDLNTEKLSGKYASRLFEGGYREMGKWIRETKLYCSEIGKEAKELLFWYATCPKCAKKYGGVQTVIFAKVD